jgi:hypothetical protein
MRFGGLWQGIMKSFAKSSAISPTGRFGFGGKALEDTATLRLSSALRSAAGGDVSAAPSVRICVCFLKQVGTHYEQRGADLGRFSRRFRRARIWPPPSYAVMENEL